MDLFLNTKRCGFYDHACSEKTLITTPFLLSPPFLYLPYCTALLPSSLAYYLTVVAGQAQRFNAAKFDTLLTAWDTTNK